MITIEEYRQKLKEFEIEYKDKKDILCQEFAMSNNPYKVGDILQDYRQIIRVEKIKWTFIFPSNIPECIYFGTELTAKLTPKKKQSIDACMYQSNVKRKLN